jgi:hypothetical protein
LKTISYDCVLIGAGAAGLMCASLLGQQSKKVLLLEKANKVGKKILMSGGGRCNFTNLDIDFKHYFSQNKHFFKSALRQYTQWDFIHLVEKYQIEYYEKTLGQLFCKEKSQVIVDLLLDECQKGGVDIKLKQTIKAIEKKDNQFYIRLDNASYTTSSLIIATGGLSIPSLGGSPFGYELAKQFGIRVIPTRAGLVPFTLHLEDKERFETLSGVSVEVEVTCNKQTFHEQLLFTHRGLSGPAMLQISSYWHPGETLFISMYPSLDIAAFLKKEKISNPNQHTRTALSQKMTKKILDSFLPQNLLDKPIKQLTDKDISTIISLMQNWAIRPNATEGYRTAEVTIGGIDSNELSSRTFESSKVPGLFFIGEVVDVTGWLGGYNFQWAWSSAYAAATHIISAE